MKLNWFKKRIIKFVCGAFFPVNILNKENLPEGSAVIVCNHLSIIDCVYLAKLNLNQNFSIIAKKELFNKKLVGIILKSYGAVAIDRDNPDVKTLLALIRNLKNGEKILLFPEGTRNKTGTTKLQSIKEGSAIFALRAKCPIVPVVIYKKARLFKRNSMIVGKPFKLTEFYDKKGADLDNVKMLNLIYEKMCFEQQNLFDAVNKKKKR